MEMMVRGWVQIDIQMPLYFNKNVFYIKNSLLRNKWHDKWATAVGKNRGFIYDDEEEGKLFTLFW